MRQAVARGATRDCEFKCVLMTPPGELNNSEFDTPGHTDRYKRAYLLHLVCLLKLILADSSAHCCSRQNIFAVVNDFDLELLALHDGNPNQGNHQ